VASIELQNIAHQYDTLGSAPNALNGISELWQDCGAYALLGPSGCGKTTLLNIISGLLRPTEGRVLFDSVDVTELSPEQRNIAQVFQFPVVYDTLSVAENLAFPLKNRGLPKARIEHRVKEVLAMLELTDRAQSTASRLSADDKQKISLGRGLVRTDVKAILFDEPLTVIDPHLKWHLRTELKKIHRQFQHTMIYVTHDQTEALTFADKVIVMYEGSVVQVGTPPELFEKPQHTFVGQFIGTPGMNVIKVNLQGHSAWIGNQEIKLANSYGIGAGPAELGIRPEYVELCSDLGLAATVVAVEDLGRHLLVRTRVDDQVINVIARHGESIPESPRLNFAPDKLNLYRDSCLVEPLAA
jgi:glycerol transport system ATP-binding protein